MKYKKIEVDGAIVPEHYVKGGIHLLEMLEMKIPGEQVEGFLRGNVIKYIFRYDQKNGVEDLYKVRWYLDELIDLKEKEVV